MSAIVEKITDANEQREGAAIVSVNKNGDYETYMRDGLPASNGVAELNTKWGTRFTTAE
jgi:hypothetical protein